MNLEANYSVDKGSGGGVRLINRKVMPSSSELRSFIRYTKHSQEKRKKKMKTIIHRIIPRNG
jgi:hypothetical protein